MKSLQPKTRRLWGSILGAGVLCAALAASVSWYFDRPGWMTIAHNPAWKLEAEQALYQSEKYDHYLVRFRFRNLSRQPLGIDLRDRPRNLIRPDYWHMGEDGRAYTFSGNEWKEIGLGLSFDYKEIMAQQMRDFKAGRFTTALPGASIEYFAEAGIGDADKINGAWRRSPLWTRGKMFLPYRSHRLQAIIDFRGDLFWDDGRRIYNSSASKSTLSLNYPILWKDIPAGAKVVALPN